MIDLELWKTQKKKLKLSLQDISNKTEISISALKDIFRGATTDPRIETVQRIEDALGLNEKPQEEITEEQKTLFALINELTDEETQELSNYIDYIISKRK